MSHIAWQDGHHIELLQGGADYFARLIADIDAATTLVHLETYIFDFTGVGVEVASALVHAARRGVAVRLMMDGAGTPEIPHDWRQRFDGAGVAWHVFKPFGWLGPFVPDRWRRLHRKLCVVDGQVAYCGGINVLDDLYDPNYGTLSAPRFDFAVRVRGPLVAQVDQVVSQFWRRSGPMRQRYARDIAQAWESVRQAGWQVLRRPAGLVRPARQRGRPAEADSERTVRAALLQRDNVRHRRQIERAYLKAIGAARHEIVIANAYFLPGKRLRRALRVAAQRGVRVRLLLQGRYEYFMQYHASRPVYGALLDAGVEIHEYAASFLHAKVGVVDPGGRAWATVGSSNLDPLSMLLSREANVAVVDSLFAQDLHARLNQAMAEGGRRLQRDEYVNRSLLTRLMDWTAWGLMSFALWVTGKRY